MGPKDRRPPRRIVVQFVAGTRLPWSSGDPVRDELQALDPAGASAFFQQFPTASFGPLFPSVPPPAIEAFMDRVTANLPPGTPTSDFLTYYQLGGIPPPQRAAAIAVLRAWSLVHHAYSYGEPPASPAIVTSDTESWRQVFLDRAPLGIDAPFAWAMDHGHGEATGFVDVEIGWKLTHADLPSGIPVISGGKNESYDREHGTGVLGIVAATQDDGSFVTGIAPGVGTVRVSPRTRASDGALNTPDAIMAAVTTMSDGEVLLIEAYAELDEVDDTRVSGYPAVPSWQAPMETIPAVYDEIVAAVAANVVVIEPTGNSNLELDKVLQENADGVEVAIFDPSARDSGAVMVGQASSGVAGLTAMSRAEVEAIDPTDAGITHTAATHLAPGARVDCFAWGEYITTLDVDSSGGDDSTASFSGTSGASAIIAGAALLLQGLAKEHKGAPMDPASLRDALRDRGSGVHTWFTDSTGVAVEDVIGVQPDLGRAIVDHLGLTPDVFLRDNLADTGGTSTGIASRSPDIILRRSEVADPDAEFGDATAADDTLGETALDSGDHFVYVRVLNRGLAPARDVTVKVYWSHPSTLVSPPWTKVGESTIDEVPPGETFVVAPVITWAEADIPGAGHYCFVATLECDDDPAPDPSTIADLADFYSFIRTENNAAWRNFDVVEVPPPPGPGGPPAPLDLPFDTPGDGEREMTLEVIGARRPGVQVAIDLPRDLHDAMGLAHPFAERYEDRERDEARVRVPVVPTPRGRRVGGAVFRAGEPHRVRLRVSVSPRAAREPFEVAVRQLQGGRPVGAVTWRFVPGGSA